MSIETRCDKCKKIVEDRRIVSKLCLIPGDHVNELGEGFNFDLCKDCAVELKKVILANVSCADYQNYLRMI